MRRMHYGNARPRIKMVKYTMGGYYGNCIAQIKMVKYAIAGGYCKLHWSVEGPNIYYQVLSLAFNR